jgi:uncharacterized protein YbjT (DUF2867 family)
MIGPVEVLVTGATGSQGGAVARALRDAGHAVRALVRDPQAARARALAAEGVRPVRGDLLDAASLAAAMAGADVTYAVTTPFGDGVQGEVRQGEAVLAAALDAGLPWLVLASVAGAAAPTAVPHFESKRRLEEALGRSGLPATVVAPTWFFENVLGHAAAIAQGRLPLALSPGRALQALALADLGAFVADLLARPERAVGARVEVAAEALTPAAMAAALADATGHPVRAEQVALDDVRARSADLAAMYGFLEDEGYAVDLAALRAAHPGVAWTPFAAWAAAQDWTPPDPEERR